MNRLSESRTILVLLIAILLVVACFITGYAWGYLSGVNDGRTSVIEKILYAEGVLLNLSSGDILTELRHNFPERLNYTELLTWESTRLNYTQKPIENRTTDPIEILKRGLGKCGEFSIVYVSICLANDIPARLVTDLVIDHMWAEANPSKDGRTWVHVEPTDSCDRIQKGRSIYDTPTTVDNPSYYAKKNFEMVFSFQVSEERQVQIVDITSFYSP